MQTFEFIGQVRGFNQTAFAGFIVSRILVSQGLLVVVDFLFQRRQWFVEFTRGINPRLAGIGFEETAVHRDFVTTQQCQFFAQQDEIAVSGFQCQAVIFAKTAMLL